MKKIEIYSAKNCDHCRRAKAILTLSGLQFDELDIGIDENHDALMERLPRSRTIPRIFVDGEYIGGCEDLEVLQAQGVLLRHIPSRSKFRAVRVQCNFRRHEQHARGRLSVRRSRRQRP